MMATRHRALSAADLMTFNIHLAFEGAMCCPTCREVYVLDMGECPACLARGQAALARALKAQAKRHDEQRLREASAARSLRVEQAAHKPVSFDIHRSPLWDSIKDGR